MTKPIPDGYHRLGCYLSVDGATAAIDWYAKVFGATERMRLPAPGGKIGHAELAFGDSVLMLSDAWPGAGAQPPADGRTTVGLHLYVEDADATFAAAVAAGAAAVQPVAQQFYGDRTGQVRDPFGHLWTIATHVEDVAPDEIARRMQAMFGTPAA